MSRRTAFLWAMAVMAALLGLAVIWVVDGIGIQYDIQKEIDACEAEGYAWLESHDGFHCYDATRVD